MSYAKLLSTQNSSTPVSQPMPGREADQIANSTAGYVFKLDDWSYLDRFLILGSDKPSYYASAQKLSKDAAANVLKLIAEDPIRVVNRIVEISNEGRAPKNDPAIFALALTAINADEKGRAFAYEALPKVCRIGTHLFQFVEAINEFGKWNAAAKRGITNWYNKKAIDKLAIQLLKYQSRNGWSHRDVLRLAHVKPYRAEQSAMYGWVTAKDTSVRDVKSKEGLPAIFTAYSDLHRDGSVKAAIEAIEQFDMTWEMLPTQVLKEQKVWEALIPKLGYTALLRNLGRLSSIGVLNALSNGQKQVVEKLEDAEFLKRSRVHPITILSAIKTYGSGRGVKGNMTWSVNQRVLQALNSAFYESFKNVEPTGKNFLLGIDCSGSMFGVKCNGLDSITAAEAAAVMGLAIAKTESNYWIGGFSHHIEELKINPSMDLDTAMKVIERFNWSYTKLSAPVELAIKSKMDVDCFVSITDNEVNCGRHPREALRDYRKVKPEARYIVCGTSVTNFTVADPTDPLSLDLVGFDSAVPQLVSNFAAGKL
jgi:60 kDa SS-A/Ro ribonucleoprotein